jgi:hypothetical protein
MVKPRKEDQAIELHPDAWARFERAIDTAVKSPPQHRKTKKSAKKKATKSTRRVKA